MRYKINFGQHIHSFKNTNKGSFSQDVVHLRTGFAAMFIFMQATDLIIATPRPPGEIGWDICKDAAMGAAMGYMTARLERHLKKDLALLTYCKTA